LYTTIFISLTIQNLTITAASLLRVRREEVYVNLKTNNFGLGWPVVALPDILEVPKVRGMWKFIPRYVEKVRSSSFYSVMENRPGALFKHRSLPIDDISLFLCNSVRRSLTCTC